MRKQPNVRMNNRTIESAEFYHELHKTKQENARLREENELLRAMMAQEERAAKENAETIRILRRHLTELSS